MINQKIKNYKTIKFTILTSYNENNHVFCLKFITNKIMSQFEVKKERSFFKKEVYLDVKTVPLK